MNNLKDLAINTLKTNATNLITVKVEDSISSILYLPYDGSAIQLSLYKYIKMHYKSYRNYFAENGYTMINKYKVRTLNPDKDLLFMIDRYTICTVKETIYDTEKFITIKFIGINHKKWKSDFLSFNKKVSEMIGVNNKDILTYSVNSFSGSKTNVVSDSMKSKPISTVYTNSDEISSIVYHIDKWKEKSDLYISKGIIYKTGILLYGKPGTGKSSIISALATYYNSDVIYIDISNLENIDLNSLTPVLTYTARNKFIFVVMEEIDVVFSKERDNDDGKTNAKIRQLLQFLDSSQSPSNVVFIATTNYIERLDPALIRKGRFDIQIELDDFNKDTAKRMCKGFKLSESKTRKLLDSIKYPINPAELQTMILELL